MNAPAGFATRCRVKVQDSGGTFRDTSLLLGMDYVADAEWGESLDTSTSDCVVTFHQGADRATLSPLDEDSALNNLTGGGTPLLAPGRVYTVEVATIPSGSTPGSGDWVEAWRGRIDKVHSPGNETVVVTGRDMGSLIMDTFMEEEDAYGDDDTGVAVQDVIQAMLDAWGLSAVGLYAPVDPLWQVGRYLQRKEAVFTAAFALAQQMGWDVRYRWQDAVSGWRFTLWSPDRLTSTSVWTIPINGIYGGAVIGEDAQNCRNAVDVVYSDKGDLDSAGNPTRKKVTSTNPTSIAALGRRWMEIAEGASSAIDTEAEAQRFADSAIADLALPPVMVDLKCDLHWHLQLGDYVTVPPLKGKTTSPIQAAVYALRHRVGETGAITSLTLRGQPRTSTRRWMGMDTRPGIAPSPQFTGPPAPTGLAVQPTVNGLALTWDVPVSGQKWDAFEVHVSTSSGFTPGPSTFKGVVGGNRYDANDLTPGTTYYAKVVPLDVKKNPGAASSEVTLTARYVEPRLLQPRISYNSLVVNQEYEARNDTSGPPDAWDVLLGTWGTHFDMSTGSYTGSNALRVRTRGASSGDIPTIASGFFVVRPNTRHSLDAFVRSESIPGTTGTIIIEWYDATFADVDESLPLTISSTVDVWERKSRVVESPSDAVYGRVVIKGGSDSTVYWGSVDSVAVQQINPVTEEWRTLRHPSIDGGSIDDYLNDWEPMGGGATNPAYYLSNDGIVYWRGRAKNGTMNQPMAEIPVGYRPGATNAHPIVSNGASGNVTSHANGDLTPTGGSNTWIDLCGVFYRAEG